MKKVVKKKNPAIGKKGQTKSVKVKAKTAKANPVVKYAEYPVIRMVMSPVYLDSIKYKNRQFQFNTKMKVQISYEDGVFVCESKELQILDYGENIEEARSNFAENFVATWDFIALEKNSKLTPDAKELKRKLLNLVKNNIVDFM